MTSGSVRWWQNATPKDQDMASDKFLGSAVIAALIASVIGICAQFFGLILADAGQGAVILALDLVICPIIHILLAIPITTAAMFLMRRNLFGLLPAILTDTAILIVAYIAIVMVLGAPLSYIMMAFNYGFTYGLLLSAIFWARLCSKYPKVFLRSSSLPSSEVETPIADPTNDSESDSAAPVLVVIGAIVLVVAWQTSFWPVSEYLIKRYDWSI